MELFQKVMWFIAIPASVIFIIQMIMTFVGMDSDGATDGDVDMGSSHGEMPFHVFTFRNLINFFLGFSWTGISFYYTVGNKILLTLLAAFMGLLLVAIVLAIFYFLSRAVQSGNIDISSTVGLTATVYYPISAANRRAGKVQVSVHGAVREYDAVTSGEELKTGELVKIMGVVEENILRVEKIAVQ